MATVLISIAVAALAPGSASAGAWEVIGVGINCRARTDCKVNFKPLWDSWNNCVESNATGAFTKTVPAHGHVHLILGVSVRCPTEQSRMHWKVTWSIGSYSPRWWINVEMRVDPGLFKRYTHASCHFVDRHINTTEYCWSGGNRGITFENNVLIEL